MTWTVSIPAIASAAVPAALAAPAGLRAHLAKRRALLSWKATTGAVSYRLTVTIGGHTRVYRLAASQHAYTITLGSHRRAVVRLRAINASGTAGPAATVTIRQV